MNDILKLCDFFGIKDQETREKFCKIAVPMTYAKNQRLLSIGDRVTHMYIIIDGVMRGYRISEDGHEATDCFLHEYGQCMLGGVSLNDAHSTVNAQTLTPCKLLLIPCKELFGLVQSNPKIFNIYDKCIYIGNEMQIDHKSIIQSCSAKERYEWFLEEYPGLIDRISHVHIASFLNITPVTLSRIRRSIAEQK